MNKHALLIGSVVAIGVAGVLTYGFWGNPALLQSVSQKEAQQAPGAVAPSGDLQCGSDVSKQLVVQVVTKNPPKALLDEALSQNLDRTTNSTYASEYRECQDNLAKATTEREACRSASGVKSSPNSFSFCDTADCEAKSQLCDGAYKLADDENGRCSAAASSKLDAVARAAAQAAVYIVNNIRLESRDSTTGAVVCHATLHVDLPRNAGSAEEEVAYKLEKMEDGGSHIELEGLR